MTITDEGLSTKRRILSVCVRLFLEKGYKKTTVADITRLAGVSNSSFQHFFRAKDGALAELVRFMFDYQFNIAQALGTEESVPAERAYVTGAAVQLTLTEMDERLREIYLEAYTHDESLGFIQQATGKRLYAVFGGYQPELAEDDFIKVALGTTGMMRGFMAHPCDETFALEDKLRCYLTSELRVYKVPEAQVAEAVEGVLSLDVRDVAQTALDELLDGLSDHYDFSLAGIEI